MVGDRWCDTDAGQRAGCKTDFIDYGYQEKRRGVRGPSRQGSARSDPIHGDLLMLTVSVVIPTLDRPNLLLRALRSVFNQSYPHLDVIVVVDRPSEETIAALRAIEDPRLRVIFNPRPVVNAAAARNLGADHAKGDWIAFLDDDDEWLPEKIEKQLSFGLQRGEVLVSCLSRIVTPHSSYVLPQRIYDNETRLDEYLFDRRSARAGEGFLQTSSFMMPRSLFEKVRFYEDRLHDDWDFVLRLSNEWKIRIETVPEELAILYMEEQRPSLTSRSSGVARSSGSTRCGR